MLERRDIAGRTAGDASRSATASTSIRCTRAAQLRPDIVRDLDLARYGLPRTHGAAGLYCRCLPDGRRLRLDRRRRRRADARLDPPVLRERCRALAGVRRLHGRGGRVPRRRLSHADAAPAERRPAPKAGRWRSSRWTLRRLGGKDMFRVIRALSMSARRVHRGMVRVRAAAGRRSPRVGHPRLDARARCRPAPATR